MAVSQTSGFCSSISGADTACELGPYTETQRSHSWIDRRMPRAQIIAEVASNHGGDLQLAKQFIRAAAEHGADIVKFQSWQARHMSKTDAQYDWFEKSEL